MTGGEIPRGEARTAAVAAAQLGVEVGAIANSLVFDVDGAGGIPHTVFPTTYAELVRVTGGTPAEVG